MTKVENDTLWAETGYANHKNKVFKLTKNKCMHVQFLSNVKVTFPQRLLRKFL